MKMQRNVAKSAVPAVLGSLALCLLLAGGWYERWKRDHCGVPDVVSSRNVNGDCFLLVVANSDGIGDKEKFARTVVQMCLENSFRSTILSTDLNGYPSRLEIEVYLKKRDIEAGEPVCRIRFEPPEGSGSRYDIKEDTEEYRLYVDGKEIIFCNT